MISLKPTDELVSAVLTKITEVVGLKLKVLLYKNKDCVSLTYNNPQLNQTQKHIAR